MKGDEGDAVRLELRLPSEIRAALSRRSLVYLPLGTYEWHGEHLPIGLDALTAHGICVHTATRHGGLVCPPLYYGTGGEHANYPWTIMVDPTEMVPLLSQTLKRLQSFGVAQTILFSGHFAGEQIELLDRIATEWTTSRNTMRVKALAVSMAKEAPMAPDHAALFETTLLGALWPGRVRLDLLPALASTPSIDPDGNEMGQQRHDAGHPLYGIFGPDPRHYEQSASAQLLDHIVSWLDSEARSV